MKKLKYQKLKKEHIEKFFNKVYQEGYTLVVKDVNGDYFFRGGNNYNDDIPRIRECELKKNYVQEDLEDITLSSEKFIISDEEKFIILC